MLKITFTDIIFDASLLDRNIPLAILLDEKKQLDGYGQQIDALTDNIVSHHLAISNFSEQGVNIQTCVLKQKANYVLLLGCADIHQKSQQDYTIDALPARTIGARCAQNIKKLERESVHLFSDVDAETLNHIACGAILNQYEFTKYLSKPDNKTALKEIIISGKHAKQAEQLFVNHYSAIMQGVTLTRDLVSEPANHLYPETFADICVSLGKDGLDVTVLDEQKLTQLGMGALLGVAQGSARPPCLVTMAWHGGNPTQKPIVIAGKGVTFDTGGISIKPAAGMEEMKWDMGGAGVVTGLMKTLATRRAKINVVGIIGLVENMPSGIAMRPGDVLTSLSKQTIEVLNTDAEGRLVLADVLCYAQQQFDPEIIIDLATLTGAMIIALGHDYAGVFSNDDKLAEELTKAGNETDEKIWRMPLDAAYDKLLQSPIADMKNIGGRAAGSITAAQFLQRFINQGVKWAHLDIAGVTWLNKGKPCSPKGASGFAVQLLNRYLENLEQ
ncbi:MAG: leucyl aminopeptidase [Alphaproteobacteria bacterium]|nr:leucyl aminopeptidase [Alphaproteobacteria bacterium]